MYYRFVSLQYSKPLFLKQCKNRKEESQQLKTGLSHHLIYSFCYFCALTRIRYNLCYGKILTSLRSTTWFGKCWIPPCYKCCQSCSLRALDKHISVWGGYCGVLNEVWFRKRLPQRLPLQLLFLRG